MKQQMTVALICKVPKEGAVVQKNINEKEKWYGVLTWIRSALFTRCGGQGCNGGHIACRECPLSVVRLDAPLGAQVLKPLEALILTLLAP